MACAVVEAAVALREALLRRLADTIAGWPVQPRRATLFGSAARADGSTGSDVDLLFVRDGPSCGAWENQVDTFRNRILMWTGNHPQIVDPDPETWQRMVAESDPIVESVRADGIDLLSPIWRSG
ncbi:MAG: nucleotidyltransferase domain-containing protein [Microlunatus sp.]|nr:nucleotidyltransferase domain-containing protein [Microlunatus sp.]